MSEAKAGAAEREGEERPAQNVEEQGMLAEEDSARAMDADVPHPTDASQSPEVGSA